MRYFALLSLSILVAACREVPRPTYVIELTTDTEEHLVELWTRPNASSLRHFYAFSLELPQAAYAFQQNHTDRKQAAIGLLLDRKTMQPLTLIIVSEKGPLQDRALRKALLQDYRDRELLVHITGGGPAGRPSPGDPMFQPLGLKDGFQMYANPAAASMSTTPDRPALWGWSITDPVIQLNCAPRSAMCGLTAAYRESKLHLTIARNELAQAQQLRERLVEFLDSGLVK